MPAILEDAVKSIMKENPDMKKGAAYAIATKSLQKSGDLKEGTVEATEKGKRRGEMSKATRAKTRAKKYKIEREKAKKDRKRSNRGVRRTEGRPVSGGGRESRSTEGRPPSPRAGRDERNTSGRL